LTDDDGYGASRLCGAFGTACLAATPIGKIDYSPSEHLLRAV